MTHAAHSAQSRCFGRRLPAAGCPLGCCKVRRCIAGHTYSSMLCVTQG